MNEDIAAIRARFQRIVDTDEDDFLAVSRALDDEPDADEVLKVFAALDKAEKKLAAINRQTSEDGLVANESVDFARGISFANACVRKILRK